MTREEKWKEIDRLLTKANLDLDSIDEDLTYMEQIQPHKTTWKSIDSPASQYAH